MKMLRVAKNIFHLGDDARSANSSKTAVAMAVTMGGSEPAADRCSKLRTAAHPQAALEGLRILLTQQHAAGGQRGESDHIVIKSSLIRSIAAARRRPDPEVVPPELGLFLKACFLCKKELSPHEDVYMYRGDQGYCSQECRCRQILLDEERRDQFKASAPRSEPSRGHRRRATGSKIRASTPQTGRLLVAV